ncbi:hypothetical protein [Paraburkholderia pallida]|uniref:hypothetical protein n=1 Tax=Paraburkholderia pallida TaxID=2547399 RepID=UPI0014307407
MDLLTPLFGELSDVVERHITLVGCVDLIEILGDERHAGLCLGFGELAIVIGVSRFEARLQLLHPGILRECGGCNGGRHQRRGQHQTNAFHFLSMKNDAAILGSLGL